MSSAARNFREPRRRVLRRLQHRRTRDPTYILASTEQARPVVGFIRVATSLRGIQRRAGGPYDFDEPCAMTRTLLTSFGGEMGPLSKRCSYDALSTCTPRILPLNERCLRAAFEPVLSYIDRGIVYHLYNYRSWCFISSVEGRGFSCDLTSPLYGGIAGVLFVASKDADIFVVGGVFSLADRHRFMRRLGLDSRRPASRHECFRGRGLQ